MRTVFLNLWNGINKELRDRPTPELLLRAFKQKLCRTVAQSDVAVKAGGDQPAADGLNDEVMQGLQAFQFAAGALEFDIDLTQLCRQQAGQIGHRKVCEKVDEDDRLQTFPAGVSG